jgi:predicted permease
MNIVRFVDSVGRDLRHALRSLPRRPAFTLAAVVTLALGIGATTAIFSVVYSVLIKPLPYPDPAELVRIRHSNAAGDDQLASSNMYLTYGDENRTLASIGLWQESSATLTERGEAERLRALRVTDGTLQALGVQPMLGRWFTTAEHGPTVDEPTPVILSHAFWQRRFGGDETALGRQLSLELPGGNGTLRTTGPSQVVGVMPPDFRFLDSPLQPDIIVAVRLDLTRQAHGIYQWHMLARLAPNVTLTEARADFERMRPIWLEAWPPFPGTALQDFVNMRITPVVRPLQDDMVGGVASMLWVLMGAIGAVLLIACANIANLLLVRADARRPEFAIRAALGARPTRIARELLVESLILGAAGSALGLMLAYIGLRVVVTNGPVDLPRLHEIDLYAPVLAFTVAVSLLSTLLFGSIPALKHASHIAPPMTGGARGSSASRELSKARNTLVVVQVALALVLVVSAALMIRTFEALRDVDPGFADPATIQTARIFVPLREFPDPQQYTRMQRDILDRIAALPGVTSAGFASDVPIDFPGMGINLAVDGQISAAGGVPPTSIKFVSPGYFETMGTRMLAGRGVTWSDIEAGGRVAVISEDYARELATEPAAALGLRLRFAAFGQDAWREVVGVVQRVHENGLFEAPANMAYWPVLTANMFNNPNNGTPFVTFVVRSERAGDVSLVDEIRQAVRSVSASIPIAQERTMQDLYAGSFARTSFTLVLLVIAGAMALTLGVIGIYGVIAYVVAQRTREIGIRSALGAHPKQLERMFLRQGLALTGVGVVFGSIAAVALARLMSSLLFGIGPLDVSAYVAALAVTIAAAALASYVPARRAARIDPIETLRAE